MDQELKTGSYLRPESKGRAHPEFFTKSVFDKKRSEKEGRDCFRDVEMVRVYVPGDRNSIPEFEVNDIHRNRWEKEYEAFKQGIKLETDGTPLDEWPAGLSVSRIKELQAAGIRSVEDLAGVPDNLIMKLGPGARELRERAKTFLKLSEDNVDLNEISKKIADLEKKLEAQERELKAKDERIDDLTKGKKKLSLSNK